MPDEHSKQEISSDVTFRADPFLRWAERVDAWRVVPRLFMVLYGVICWHTADWFMHLQAPTTAQATFVSVIWGAAAAWFGFYSSTGRKW